MKNPRQSIRLITASFLKMIVFMVLITPRAEAQLDDSGDFIRAGIDDANTLFHSYLEPLGEGFGAGLNSGWVQSARPHSLFGFNLSLRVSGAIVPDAKRTFDVTSLALQNIQYANEPGNSPITSTINGPDEDGARLIARREVEVLGNMETITIADFNMPPGIGVGIVPSPMIQAGLGIVKDTELTLRYLPPVSMPFDGKVNLIGGSIKHGINQWIPGGDLFPVDLSIMIGYTSLSLTAGLDVEPEDDAYTRNPYQNQPETWDNQSLEFSSNGFNAMLLAGKNLPIIAFYGGIGYESSSTSFNAKGSYPVKMDDNPENPDFDPARPLVIQRYDDPIKLDFSGANSLRALIGMRIRLGFLSVNADYTVAKYPVASVGVGISFR
jgi:hypothetical protein